jgi:hypothetical protein
LAVWAGDVKKTKKKEGVTRNHGFPYKKEGRDSLPGPGRGNSAGPAVNGLGVSTSEI